MDGLIGFETGRECGECCSHKGRIPFYYQLQQQPIMVITACPSLQTSNRPFTSVRFVRQILYSLLGKEGLSERGVELLFGKHGIYWTHANKCYYPKFFQVNKSGQPSLKNLPSECAERFIEKEVSLLDPYLRLIIVLGTQTKAVCEPILNRFDKKNGGKFKIVYADYLQNLKDGSEYDEIRKLITENVNSVSTPADKAEPSYLKLRNIGAAVHIGIESTALKEYIERFRHDVKNRDNKSRLNASCDNDEIDLLWARNVIALQDSRFSQYLNCWTKIESIIKAFLESEFNPKKPEYRLLHLNEILFDIEKNQKNIFRSLAGLKIFEERKISNIISNKWKDLMDEYIKLRALRTNKFQIEQEYFKKWNAIYNKLRVYQGIRNLIVHSNGFIAQRELSFGKVSDGRRNQYFNFNEKISTAKIEGISIQTNTLFMRAEGVESIWKMYQAIAEFIIDLDQRLNSY